MNEDFEKIIKYTMKYAHRKYLDTCSPTDAQYREVEFWCECFLQGIEEAKKENKPEPIKKKIRL